jgi:hypothetical protein
MYMFYGDSLVVAEGKLHWMAWSQQEGWTPKPRLWDSTYSEPLTLAPRAAVSEPELAVVWSEPGEDHPLVYLARSSDGSDWDISLIPNAKGRSPVVAFVSGSDLLVAWEEEFDPQYGPAMEIWASQQDQGQWTIPKDLSETWDRESELATVAVVGGVPYVAWQESGEEGQGAWLSVASGQDWSDPVMLSAEETGGYAPSLSGDATGAVHLVWTAGSSVFHRGLLSPGAEWGPQGVVAASQIGPEGAQIAARAAAHVAWLADNGMQQQVWYSTSAAVVTPTPTVEPDSWAYLPLLLRP